MAVDRARIAAALAREEQRRRLMESVPSTERVAPAPQSRNLRRDLENLSIGVGEGITNQLEGIKGIVTDPIGSAKAGYEAIRGIVRDPSVLADALRYTAQKAGSGPLGAGEVIGEMVSPMRGKPPVMQEIDVYHGSPHRFKPEETLTVYRGENTANKGGNYWTGDPEFARQFTQSGLENEIKRSTLSAADVYTPPTPVFAGDAKGVDAAIGEARRLGKSVVRFSEGKGQPDSFYVVEKTALGRTGNPLGAFNASKIGTGEGAQAYGHGIYLAESPEVAKTYKQVPDFDDFGLGGYVMPEKMRQELVKLSDEADKAKNWETEAGYGAARVYDELLAGDFGDPAKLNQMIEKWYWNQPERLAEARQAIKKATEIENKYRGNLYTADLPDEMVDRMLDWDKPLSEQPEAVRKAVRQINAEFAVPYAKLDEPLGFYVGKLGDAVGGHANASKLMASYGVPGIKYLDSGSRGQGGSGTRNFVVFPGEEKKVKILKRE